MHIPKLRIRRPRLTYANVAATLALVMAASMGGAYAHGKVGSALIKNNAVKSRHIGWQQVKTGDLAKRSVSTNRIKRGAVARGKIKPNARSTVIRYSLGAHDFGADSVVCGTIPSQTDAQLARSQWEGVVRTAVFGSTFFDSAEAFGMVPFAENTSGGQTRVCVWDKDTAEVNAANVSVFRTVQNWQRGASNVGRGKARPQP